MRRLLKPTAYLIFLSLILLLASTSQVFAQQAVAGPASNNKTAAAAPSKAPATVSQRFEKEGVVVNYSLQSKPDEKGNNKGLVAGANAVISFRLTDARTGQPITGLHPAGWVISRKSAKASDEAECKETIRTLTGGLLSIRADIDLNNYLILTLNHDNTITYINPQVSFSTTKLEGITQLPGPGADWALASNKELLYVTLPEQSAVAVINTLTKRLLGTISTGEKAKPMRIYIQPDGRYIWVGLDDSAQVAVIDTNTNKLVATIPVGQGLHNIAFTSDSSMAFVTNSASDNVSIIDTKGMYRLADINVGKTPVPVAYSAASRLMYVAAINGASIAVIDPSTQRLVKTIPAKRGVVALRFEPKGRFGFIVNQVESTVSILDASTNTISGSAAVVKSPDQLMFTQRFAYVRGVDSEKISLLDTGEVAKGKLSPIEVVIGRAPASSLPEEIGVADMMAPSPEGNAAMIANTPDQMIYYYVEGLMAPMGTFTNYKRRPHALMLIDRSLNETEPGLYSAHIKLTGPGQYDVPFLLDQPRIINCFPLEIKDVPGMAKPRTGPLVAVEPLFKDKSFKPQDKVSLQFRLLDPDTKQPITGLQDVQVLVFEPPGIWQQRQFAKEVDKGVYEIVQELPHNGLYYVMLRIASRGVALSDLPYTPLKIASETKP